MISRIESISGAWGRFQMLVKVNPVVMMFWTCWIEATRPVVGGANFKTIRKASSRRRLMDCRGPLLLIRLNYHWF